MLRRELGNLVYKGGVPVIIAIITLIIGIPGAIWATIQIISYRKNGSCTKLGDVDRN